MFLDEVPEAQTRQRQEGGVALFIGRLVDWPEVSKKDSGNEFPFTSCKKVKRIAVAILVGQDRSP